MQSVFVGISDFNNEKGVFGVLYVWIGLGIIVAVVVIGMLCYVAFNKKSKIPKYKVEDKKEEAIQEVKEDKATEQPSLELNVNGAILSEDDFNFSDLNNKNLNSENFTNSFDSGNNYNDFSGLGEYDDSAFDFDSDFFDDDYGQNGDDVKRSEIVNEIHKMSPKMKAIILADVLDKKHF